MHVEAWHTVSEQLMVDIMMMKYEKIIIFIPRKKTSLVSEGISLFSSVSHPAYVASQLRVLSVLTGVKTEI